MGALAKVLMAWIAANSSYSTAEMPIPRIVNMSPAELTAEAYSDVPHLMPESRVDDRVLALYNFEDGPDGTIYILGPEWGGSVPAPDENPEDDPIYQERLLHELVHHVQRLSGAYDSFPCRNFSEREAYKLGGQYLRQMVVKDPLPNRNYLARIYSRC